MSCTAGTELKLKTPFKHPRITVNTSPARLENYIAVNGEDEEEEEDSCSTDADSPVSPKVEPFRDPTRRSALSPAFQRKALRSASMGGNTIYISRDAQKQFRLRAAFGSFRDRMSPASPHFQNNHASQKPDAPDTPPPVIEIQGEIETKDDRKLLSQRIRTFSSKRQSLNSNEPLHNMVSDCHTKGFIVPTLDVLTEKYREKFSLEDRTTKRKFEDHQSAEQPPRSPKSPKSPRKKSLRELLERRTTLQARP